ncbi:MAG: HAMP domain-containing protein, partial [Gammaproteobacteria bacterium]|nr:HAMP domain-containing protein [Gammaproteobacteria bacterium]
MTTPTLMRQKPDLAAQKRRASMMVGTIAVIAFLTAVFALYQADQTGLWQLYVIGGTVLLTGLIQVSGLWFIQRGQIYLGVGLMLGTSMLMVPLYSYLFAGIGLAMGIALAMFSLILINLDISPKQMQVWFIAIFSAAVITILFDLFGSPNRPSLVAFQILISSLAIVAVIAFMGVTYWFFDSFNLQTKLVLSFLSVILVVLGVLSFLIQRNLTASLGQVAGQDLHNQVRSQPRLIEAALDSQVDLLQSFSGSQTRQNWIMTHNQGYEGLTETAQIPALLAEREQLWPANSTEAEAFIASRLDNQVAADLLNLQALFPAHLELLLTDQYGGIIAATQPSRTYNQADEPWWQTAYNQGQGQLYIGQPERDENRQTMVLPLAIPLLDEQKQVIGILHSTYRLTAILAKSQTLPGGTNMAILFPDDQLYALENGQLEALSATEAVFFRDGEAVGYGQMPFRGQERLLAWVTFEDDTALTDLNWQFIIAQEPQIGLALVEEQRRNIILLSMGGIGLVILSAFYIAGRISRPLNRVTLAAQQVVAGDLKAVAPVTTADEVGLLAQNFNAMADRLRDLIDNLE